MTDVEICYPPKGKSTDRVTGQGRRTNPLFNYLLGFKKRMPKRQLSLFDSGALRGDVSHSGRTVPSPGTAAGLSGTRNGASAHGPVEEG